MLYFQSTKFEHLDLIKFDQQENPMSMIEWTPKVRKCAKNEDFKTILDNFMYISYIVFHGDHPPMLFLECKKLL